MNSTQYTGMSLTDRLTQAGLLDQFSQALRAKDETALLLYLTQVELSEDQARDTIKSLLLDPNSHKNFN